MTSHSGVQRELQALGSVAELQASSSVPVPARVNAHIHLPPNFSAFENVAQVVQLASQQQMDVLGVSNYYDFQAYAPFARDAQQAGIFPLYGLEVIALLPELQAQGIKINDPGNPGKMYLCGKGITAFETPTPAAQDLLHTLRANDSQRMAGMVERLRDIFRANGLQNDCTPEALKEQIARRHGCPADSVYLQERHIAQAFQELLFARVAESERTALLSQIFQAPSKAQPHAAVPIQNEIRTYLMKAGRPGFVAESFLSFKQAYELILELGGIPCYPVLADGAAPICAYESSPEKLVADLQSRNIFCAELIPIRNKIAVLRTYVETLHQAGMVVTAGTEHNTLDLLPLEPACVDGPVPEDLKQIFREGACVLAAHQFMVSHDGAGFVNSAGVLNPAYRSNADRIAAFSTLGAAVIQRFKTLQGK